MGKYLSCKYSSKYLWSRYSKLNKLDYKAKSVTWDNKEHFILMIEPTKWKLKYCLYELKNIA